MRTTCTINGKPCPDWLLHEFVDHLIATFPEDRISKVDAPREFARFLANKFGTPVTGEHMDGTEHHFALPEDS